MRFQLQDFFQHGDMVLRLRHRQPFVALGPPSSWPDRRRVAKKHKKEEVGKKNEKNAKLPLFLWEKRWSFWISRICPRFKGGEDLWLGWGRWFSWLHVHTSFKISNDSDKMRPRFVDLNNNNNNNNNNNHNHNHNNNNKKKKKKSLSGFFFAYEFSLWVFQRVEVKQLRSHWTAMRCMAMHRLWAQEVSVSEHQPWPPEDAPRRTHETSWDTWKKQKKPDTFLRFVGDVQILTHVNSMWTQCELNVK